MILTKFCVAVVALVCCLFVTVGCATVGTGIVDPLVHQAVQLIASGSPDDLLQHSAVPFIVDGEILYRAQDVLFFWTSLRAADFDLQNYGTRAVGPVDLSGIRIFSDSFEMKVFFQKQVPEGTKLATIQADGKSITLLLDNRKGLVIRGMAIGGQGKK